MRAGIAGTRARLSEGHLDASGKLQRVGPDVMIMGALIAGDAGLE